MKLNWLTNYSDDIVLVSDTEDCPTNASRGCPTEILSFKFVASLKLSSNPNNVIFFRSCYHILPSDKSQNYFQAQLGYSFNIFDRKIEPPPINRLKDFKKQNTDINFYPSFGNQLLSFLLPPA
jgi:hypothetical protein